MRDAIDLLAIFADENAVIPPLIEKLQTLDMQQEVDDIYSLRAEFKKLAFDAKNSDIKIEAFTLAGVALGIFHNLTMYPPLCDDVLIKNGFDFGLLELMQFNHALIQVPAEDWVQREPLSDPQEVQTRLQTFMPPSQLRLQPGRAVKNGDCFFDAVLQVLHQSEHHRHHTIKSLRECCREYVSEISDSSDLDRKSICTSILSDHGSLENYQQRISMTANASTQSWWAGTSEARILAKKLGLKFHIIEMTVDPLQGYVMPQLITPVLCVSRFLTDEDYDDPNLIQLVLFDSHYVPLLAPTEFNLTVDNLEMLDPICQIKLDKFVLQKIRALAVSVTHAKFQAGKNKIVKSEEVEVGETLLVEAANLGHVEAANLLSNIYFNLEPGIRRGNFCKGLYYLKVAIQLGDPEARLKYAGFLFESNLPFIPQNNSLAAKILDELVEENYFQAISIKLAMLMYPYEAEEIVNESCLIDPKHNPLFITITDPDKLHDLSGQGSISATQGLIQYYGERGEHDLVQIYQQYLNDLTVRLKLQKYQVMLALIEKGSALGDGKYSYVLSQIYLNGRSDFIKGYETKPDIKAALYYLELSLAQGNTDAALMLANIYLKDDLAITDPKNIGLLSEVTLNVERAKEVLKQGAKSESKNVAMQCRHKLNQLCPDKAHIETKGKRSMMVSDLQLQAVPRPIASATNPLYTISSPKPVVFNEIAKTALDMFGDTQLLDKWIPPEKEEFGYGHIDALSYLIYDAHHHKEHAVQQINNLSSSQASWLPLLQRYGFDASTLPVWLPLGDKKIQYYSETHMRMILQLISKKVELQEAVSAFAYLTEGRVQYYTQLQALSNDPEMMVTTRDLFDWQGDTASTDMNSQYAAAVFFLTKGGLAPKQALKAISGLTAERAAELSVDEALDRIKRGVEKMEIHPPAVNALLGHHSLFALAKNGQSDGASSFSTLRP